MIHTLITDIYSTISNKKEGWFSDEISSKLGADISRTLSGQLGEVRAAPRLRLSALGPRCPSALWSSIHTPHLAETMPAWAEIKFSYGHILEALAITLAKASGHTVTGEQDELCVDGVYGHRDCVIDGNLVDVKSCSSRSFLKIQSGSIGQDDSFGWLDQLDGYLVGSLQDPTVTNKQSAYILAVDKTLGHMVLYQHFLREKSIRDRIADYKRIIALPERPKCTCGTVEYGKAGNRALDTKASYNVYKHVCFPHLRTFLYASGPVYLTKVVRQPDVPEVDKFGKTVH